VDSNACRETLATLLSQEISALDQLAALLEREHELLAANDVAALEVAMVERQTCVSSIVRVEDERRSLCRMLGHSTDLPGLERLLAWCDPNGSLKTRWAECASRGARCRNLNDRNGALVNARLKRVESLLGAITGRPPEGSTYSPAGAYSSPTAGRVLAVEA
jgi:flagellar biosynthesis protein FlgN